MSRETRTLGYVLLLSLFLVSAAAFVPAYYLGIYS